jgi:hypothetical protein
VSGAYALGCMGVGMLVLSDEQLAQIKAAAQPIPRALRETYLERLAALLVGRQFSNGDVQRAAAQAQRELIGSPTL